MSLSAQDPGSFEMGLMHYTKMDLDEAILALYDAVAEDPTNPDAWFYRGLTREAIGEHTGALSDLNKALELDPENVHILISRAKVLKGIGQRQRASTDLEKALELQPDGRRARSALMMLGQMHLEQNSYREAAATYDRLVEISPTDPVSYYFRGLALSHVGDHEMAIKDYSRSLELDAGSYDAYEAMAIEYIHTGNKDKACEYLDRAEELGSLNTEALLSTFCN